MSIKKFCDICRKEMPRNMVTERLIVQSLSKKGGGFSAEVIVTKNETDDDGDLCFDCLMGMLNQKPKRKYIRKPKAELIVTALSISGELLGFDEPIVTASEVATALAEAIPKPVPLEKGKEKKTEPESKYFIEDKKASDARDK